jgi:hypothetical protein
MLSPVTTVANGAQFIASIPWPLMTDDTLLPWFSAGVGTRPRPMLSSLKTPSILASQSDNFSL